MAWITVAQLLRPQGRKGELLAELLTDFPERFETHPHVLLAPPGFTGAESDARSMDVASFWLPVGRNVGRIVLHFAGVDSIDAAEKLAGLEVLIPEADRLPLEDEDSNYVSDLIDCTLYDHETAVGTVSDVQFTTTPDGSRHLEDVPPLLVIDGLDEFAGQELLIPFAKSFLISVDTDAKKILMQLPEGLLEINRTN